MQIIVKLFNADRSERRIESMLRGCGFGPDSQRLAYEVIRNATFGSLSSQPDKWAIDLELLFRGGDYDEVATIEVEDLDDAFAKTQNVDHVWNAVKPCRSASVGDVFVNADTGEAFAIDRMGFKKIA